MSSNDAQKADQIAHRCYSKLALVVNHARATIESSPDAKLDKWFNLEIPDPELFKEHTRIYRAISSAPTVPVFRLQVLLAVPELVTNQVLVHHAPDSSRVRIEPAPRYIVLEAWSLAFAPHAPSYDHTPDVQPSTMYKYGIPLFRSIFTLLRVLPAWKLARRLRRRVGGNRNGNFSIRLRVDGADDGLNPGEILDFGTPPSPSTAPLQNERQTLPPITHPMGELAVSVVYLTVPDFRLDTLESLESSRLLSLEEGHDFTPTLIKNQQRDSISGSPGSLPLRTSLPRSPPRSVAERFVIPPQTSTHVRSPSFTSGQGTKGSPAGSPRLGNIPLPVSRNLSGAGMGTSGVSDSSSSRQGASIGSREDVSTLAARMRRESLQGRGTDSPTGVPIRRTPIMAVNAFKSSTISSGSPSLHSPSPSLRQPSPLAVGTGPSLPSRPAQSPTSSRVPPSPTSNFPSSPVAPFRPSPPFVPSSLGSGRPPSDSSSPTGFPASGSPRTHGKRYSSSFGQRYPGVGGGEASPKGSPGSAPREFDRTTTRPSSIDAGRPGSGLGLGSGLGSGSGSGAGSGSPRFVGAQTDDEDLSAFVQEIDARRPLASGHDSPQSPLASGPRPLAREETLRQESFAPRPPATISPTTTSAVAAAMPGALSAPGPGPGVGRTPVLTSTAEIDTGLRELENAFFASLQGLGRGDRRRARAEPSGASGTSGASGSTDQTERQSAQTVREYPARRRDSPLTEAGTGGASGEGSAASSGVGLGIAGVPLPRTYVRPRLASTGSVRSGFSIASEEVIGRMDPEVGGEDARRSGGPVADADA